MARIFIDGFETGSRNFWPIAVNATDSSVIISGDYSAKMEGVAQQKLMRILGAEYSECYIGISARLSQFNCPVLFFTKNTTKIIAGISINPGGQLNIRLGTAAVATSTAVLSTGVNYRIELYAKIATVDGLIEVKLNNSSVVSYAGNTQQTTFTALDGVGLGAHESLSVSMPALTAIDDIVVDSTTWPGNGRIAAVVPNAAGDSTAWTPSVSSNWECVDEIPAATADYVHSNSSGAIDLYGISSLTSNATDIKCVQLSAYAEKEGTPAINDLYVAMSLNSTVVLSEALTPGAAGSPIWISKLWELNPMTGSSFTIAEFSSIQIGIQGATT